MEITDKRERENIGKTGNRMPVGLRDRESMGNTDKRKRREYREYTIEGLLT